MNYLSDKIRTQANIEVLYNLFLTFVPKYTPKQNESVSEAVKNINENAHTLSEGALRRLEILNNAVSASDILGTSIIGDLTVSEKGLVACSFTRSDGSISVVFKGTGSGEWIDNGEGLSGVSEENTYRYYRGGKEILSRNIPEDYATDQQAEALNWFRYVASKNRWSGRSNVTVSGHSKGGNKAQFVALHSLTVRACYSFDGQGFSPEALASFEERYRNTYSLRRKKIYSLSASNDIVNVLGERLMSLENIYFFDSPYPFHNIESLLDENGLFLPQSNQGALSKYAEGLSRELMKMPPDIRRYATVGVMNIFQKYVGNTKAIGGEGVSLEETLAGIAVALAAFLGSIIPKDTP